jgi:membrane protease YdiL (CAAX protease family)
MKEHTMSETIDVQVQLDEKWLIFWWALGIGLLALGIAYRQGFFKPFLATYHPTINGIDVLKGFTFFLFIEIFLIPVIAGIILTLKGENLSHLFHLNQQVKEWLNLSIIFGGFVGVLLAYLQLTKGQRQLLWRQTSSTWVHNVGVGITAWFVSYPLVLAFSQIVSLAAWHFFHHSFNEQVAVQHIRQSLGNPLLFGTTAVAIITIVPFTEELLFRGLLQTWLKRKFHNPILAIVLSSLTFAAFHYSSAQGLTNIELLSSLFLLSCMLGYVYERQRSLWAPIGLHGFFNLMSLLMISKEP